MKNTVHFIGIAASLMLLALLFGCGKSSNANDSAASASKKFIGTWKVAAESEIDFKGGPITFKEDYTYSAQKTTDPSSSVITGSYTIKDEKLFLGGELAKFGEAGMSIESDGRMKMVRGDKTIYFIKS